MLTVICDIMLIQMFHYVILNNPLHDLAHHTGVKSTAGL